MSSFRIFLFILFLSGISACQKEQTAPVCINVQQKNALVQALEPFTHDTSQITAAERQLMNDIRTIANDVDALSDGIDTTLSVHDCYNRIKSNFLQHAALVEAQANTFYHGSEAKIILAKNAFVLMSYDALQRKYPEFMWTQLGVFAANEVRSGLVLALSMRHTMIQKNIHIPVNNMDMAEAMLVSSQILIQGQIDVLTDIGSLGILNRRLGAAAIKNEPWLTAEAREGFSIQEQAEDALKQKDCNAYMDLQTKAAIQFGAHEQIYILQPMWDKPLMQQFADLDKFLIQATNQKFVFFGDIFIGTNKNTESAKGYTIKLPAGVNDLSDAQQRVNVAINGFTTLNMLRKDARWSYWIDYSQIRIGYFRDVYSAPGIE